MSARRLAYAAAASVLLHGAAAAAIGVWERSRSDVASRPNERNIAVDLVWAAGRETVRAVRPPASALPASAPAEMALAAASLDASAETVVPAASEIATAADAGAQESALRPGPSSEVAARVASESLDPIAPGASLVAAVPSSAAIGVSHDTAAKALPVAVARIVAVAATPAGSEATVVAADLGPMWVPAEGGAAPRYPPLARRRGLEGQTVLRVEVLTSGESGTVAVLSSSGHAVLDDAALAAVRRWKFVPAADIADAVASFVEVPVRFRLFD